MGSRLWQRSTLLLHRCSHDHPSIPAICLPAVRISYGRQAEARKTCVFSHHGSLSTAVDAYTHAESSLDAQRRNDAHQAVLDTDPSHRQAPRSRNADGFSHLLVPGTQAASLKAVHQLLEESKSIQTNAARNTYLLRLAVWLQKHAKTVESDVPGRLQGRAMRRATTRVAQMRGLNTVMGMENEVMIDRTLDTLIGTYVIDSLQIVDDLSLCGKIIHALARQAYDLGHTLTQRSIVTLLQPHFLRFVGVTTAESVSEMRTTITQDIAQAFTLSFSLEEEERRWKNIWQRKPLFLVAARVLRPDPKRRLAARPDILLLKAATRLDNTGRKSNQESKVSSRRETSVNELCTRLEKLHFEMLGLGIAVDNRWAMMLITALARNLAPSKATDEMLTYDHVLHNTKLAHELFFGQLHYMAQPAKGNEALLYSVLDLEINTVTALITYDKQSHVQEKHILSHLNWIKELTKMLAVREKDATSADLSKLSRQQTASTQQIRFSAVKAKYATINLQLLCDDITAAFGTLQSLLECVTHANLNRSGAAYDADPRSLHHHQRLCHLTRSAMINVLTYLCRHVGEGQQQCRKRIMTLLGWAQQSLEAGVWDVLEGDEEAKVTMSRRSKRGPSFDFARLWSRGVSALSPAASRDRRTHGGVSYKHDDRDGRHGDDFFAVIELLIETHTMAVQREVADGSGQVSGDPTRPTHQPWLLAFKDIFQDDLTRVSRMIWSLSSQWSRPDAHFSQAKIDSDPKVAAAAAAAAQQYNERLQIIVEKVFVGFHLAPRAWVAASIALKQTLHHVPTRQGRERAQRLFDDLRPQARTEERTLHDSETNDA